MWPFFIVAGITAFVIRELTKEWGWNRNWEQNEISSLPKKPGVYILYNQSKKVVHVESTGNLIQRLIRHEKKSKIQSFDWIEMNSKGDAYELEMELQQKLKYNGK